MKPSKALRAVADAAWNEGMRLGQLSQDRPLTDAEKLKMREAATTIAVCIQEYHREKAAAEINGGSN